MALALDPRDRYRTANEMRRALHDGARGIPPARPGDAAATRARLGRYLGDDRPAERRAAPSALRRRRVATRRPRQGPPRSRPAAAAPARSAQRRRSGRGRLVGLLLGLIAVALVVVAIVVLTAPAPTKVVLRNVVYSDVQQTASALKQLIAENTKQ